MGGYGLAEGQPPYGVGEEKVGSRKEKYTVQGKVKDENKEYEIEDIDWWTTINVGDTIYAKAIYDSKLEKIKE